MKKGTRKCMGCRQYGRGYAEFIVGGERAVLCPSCADAFAGDYEEDSE